MKNLMFIMSGAITGCDCGGAEILRIIKFVFILLDIVFFIAPILLIVLVSIDLGKNVIAGKDDEMKKHLNITIKRIIYCMVLFLVPTIIQFAVSLVGDLGVDYAKCITIATEEDLTDYETCGLIHDLANEGNVEKTDESGQTIDGTLTTSTLKIKNLPKMIAANEWMADYEEQYILTTGNKWYVSKGTDEYIEITTYVDALFKEQKEKFNNDRNTVLKDNYFSDTYGYQPKYINNTKLKTEKKLKDIKSSNQDYYDNIIAWLKNCLGPDYHSYIYKIDNQYVWYSTYDHDGDNEGSFLVWIGNGNKTGEYFEVKWTEPPKGSCQSALYTPNE